jgi:serine/threonine protein kinase
MSAMLPEIIGNFRIVGKIGQGGMGAVYRAMHGTLERPVALKILPAEFASHPEYVMRFLREARTIATLRHENIVQVYDAGEQNGRYFIAMELVEGFNLLKHAEEHKTISEQEGLDLLLQAARGLAAAHAKGLVHRDVKPENMLLGQDKILRIVDFGLVMESSASTQLTATGACLGTPMYMSPEQADGAQADARADIYSLGISFFRIFTGQAPFVSPTVMNLLYKHKFEAPPVPSALRPDLSTNVSRLLLHMIAKRREDRPQDAQAVVNMIEGIKMGQPIPPPPPFPQGMPPPMQPPSLPPAMPPAMPQGTPPAMLPPVMPPPVPSGFSATPPPAPPAMRPAAPLSAPVTPAPSGAFPAKTSSSMPLAMAAVAGVSVLAGVYFLFIKEKPPQSAQTTQEAEKGTASNTPPPDPAKLPENMQAVVAKGDEAFKALRYQEALDNYKIALAEAPANAELKGKIAGAERKLRYTAAMRDGDALAARNAFEEALAKYEQATPDDDGTTAKERAEKIKQQIAQRKPVEPEPAPVSKNPERDGFMRKAADADKKQQHEEAAEFYLKAALLSEGLDRATLTGLANDCRRKVFLSKARDAEEKKDPALALELYKQAQALKSDKAVEDKIAAIQKIYEGAKAAEGAQKAFEALLRDGQAALDAGDFKTARIKFGEAKALAKDRAEPDEKLSETDARDLLARGDAAAKAGNAASAITFYNEVQKAHAPLAAEAQARLAALQKSIAAANTQTLQKIDRLVAEAKDDTALTELMSAIKADPANRELKSAKNGLEALQAGASIYKEMQKLIDTAQSHVSDLRDIDDDDRVREFRKRFAALSAKFADKAGKVRPLFAQRNFDGMQTGLTAARADAADLSAELTAAADLCDKRAEKAASGKTGVDLGPISVKGGGDKKKADKLRDFARRFRTLSQQARDLKN